MGGKCFALATSYLYGKVNWRFIHVRILVTFFESVYSLQSSHLIPIVHIFWYNAKYLYCSFSPKNLILNYLLSMTPFHITYYSLNIKKALTLVRRNHTFVNAWTHMCTYTLGHDWREPTHTEKSIYGPLVKDPSSLCSEFCLWCKQNCQKAPNSHIWIIREMTWVNCSFSSRFSLNLWQIIKIGGDNTMPECWESVANSREKRISRIFCYLFLVQIVPDWPVTLYVSPGN